MSWETDLVNEYQMATGNRQISMPAVANWAITNGKYRPPPTDEVARLANKLSRACRSNTL